MVKNGVVTVEDLNQVLKDKESALEVADDLLSGKYFQTEVIKTFWTKRQTELKAQIYILKFLLLS